jgi:MoxR-like ATPase
MLFGSAAVDEVLVRNVYNYLVEELSKHIYGQPLLVKTLATAGVASLCGIPYHVLILGPPGTGKTWSVQCLCKITGLPYARVQGNPDLLPGDILGEVFPYYDSLRGEVRVEPLLGPIFKANGIGAGKDHPLALSEDVCGILFVDEINRMHPRTLNFLVEVMAEQQVTIKGLPKPLKVKLSVIATANPLQDEGTFTIPAHIIDRFNVIIELNYPDEESENIIVMSAFKRLFGIEPNPITVAHVVKFIRTLREAKLFVVSTRVAINMLEWLFLNYNSTEPKHLLEMSDEEWIGIVRKTVKLSPDELNFLYKFVKAFKETLSKEVVLEKTMIKVTEEYLKTSYINSVSEEQKELVHMLAGHHCEGVDCSVCGKCWRNPVVKRDATS